MNYIILSETSRKDIDSRTVCFCKIDRCVVPKYFWDKCKSSNECILIPYR